VHFRGVSTSIAPCLLVASPGLHCPFFHHTVVLLVEHDADGSLGFVVNRPGDVPLAALFETMGLPQDRSAPGAEVWIGGPVSPETGWVLYDRDSGELPHDHLRVGRRVGLTASRAVLEALAEGEGPTRYAVILGYAGWGPGQLDAELEEGSWIVTDAAEHLVFDVDVDHRWEAALATLGIEAGRVFSYTVGEA
jgi:putative transcriptional regulator